MILLGERKSPILSKVETIYNMELTFKKMHGLGNDFILIDCIKQPNVRDLSLEDLSKRFCNRRFGIGADQMLLLYPSATADFKMNIFNADGGEVEMCGNGIRCLGKYIWDQGLSKKALLEIETLAGIIKLKKAGKLVKVDMGEPVFEPEKIPLNISRNTGNQSPIIDYSLKIKNKEFKITCVSMGNPHAVIFIDEEVSEFPVHAYGPEIEKHPIFPKRTNVEFANVKNKKEVSMRVWERGSGETMACGTGASAAGVAAMLKGLTEKSITVHLLGGNLVVEWQADKHVYLTGPAAEVFDGKITVLTEEKRRHKRHPYSVRLDYFKAGKLEEMLSAISVDISDSGISLVSNYPLEPGHVVIFKESETSTTMKVAIVQWSVKTGENYMAGLMFV